MSKILLAGNDLRLLATRAALMARTHAGVVCCRVEEAAKTIQQQRPDLVVLCHSLTEAQAIEITEAARLYSPGTKILMVISNASGERLYRGARFDATSTAEPNRLLACAASLLNPSIRHANPDPLPIAGRLA